MAIVARFYFDVPFGKKNDMFAVIKKWEPFFEKEMGFAKPEILVGSIGAAESRIELNHRVASLAALEAIWDKLNNPRMGEFQREMAPFIVPGSHRWEILKIREG